MALVADAVCKEHQPGWDHPESPRRFDAVMQGLESAGLLARLARRPCRQATPEQLALAHTEAYVELVRREVERGEEMLSTGDTALCADSYAAACYAAGAVIAGVDAVLDGGMPAAFCVTRPPGHHASADVGMGFCLFNNVAVGARYAQQRYGVERVLIVDWDVHHGNGTQDIFYRDQSVYFFSAHQAPLYPMTGWPHEIGAEKGEGTTMNVCYPAESDGRVILEALRGPLTDAMRIWHPDLVMISAGFDARQDDPLGHAEVTDDQFAELTHAVMELAGDSAQGRIVSVLEGGYNLNGLASAAAAHVSALCDVD
jgi:acetoin utilization deacetylase AcuC-like enzyme